MGLINHFAGWLKVTPHGVPFWSKDCGSSILNNPVELVAVVFPVSGSHVRSELQVLATGEGSDTLDLSAQVGPRCISKWLGFFHFEPWDPGVLRSQNIWRIPNWANLWGHPTSLPCTESYVAGKIQNLWG